MVETLLPRWEDLPNEIWYDTWERLHDLQLLCNLLSTSRLLQTLFASLSHQILTSIVHHARADQLRTFAAIIMILRHFPSRRNSIPHDDQTKLRPIMTAMTYQGVCVTLPALPNQSDAFRDMATLYSQTSHFVALFIASRCRQNGAGSTNPILSPPPLLPSEPPASQIELYRLHRAFWRYWLICEITYRTPVTSRSEHPIKAAQALRGLRIWELEEIYFIHQFL